MLQKFSSQKGQGSFGEYTVVLIIAMSAIGLTTIYLQRGLQARVRDVNKAMWRQVEGATAGYRQCSAIPVNTVCGTVNLSPASGGTNLNIPCPAPCSGNISVICSVKIPYKQYEPYYVDTSSEVDQQIKDTGSLVASGGGTTGIARKTLDQKTTSITASKTAAPKAANEYQVMSKDGGYWSVSQNCSYTCTPVDGVCNAWGPCSATACGAPGIRPCTSSTSPQCGGAPAPTTQSCTGTTPVNGVCNVWGTCSASCGAGTQTCASSTPPQCGGAPAPTTQSCTGTTSINGTCTAWSGVCSAVCGPGTEACASSTPPQCGGAPAPTSRGCTGTTPINGSCTVWSSICSVTCGTGTQACMASTPPQCGGVPAPTTRICTGTTPVNGFCNVWGTCSATVCGVPGTQTCASSTPPQCGGAPAPTSKSCTGNTPVNGMCNVWRTCSATVCGAPGTQTCASSTPPQCGGAPAPTSQACVGNTPVDGVCLEFGSRCSNPCGSGYEKCIKQTPPQCGGKPALTETRGCWANTSPCCQDGGKALCCLLDPELCP
jgi:hypothetical protein